MKPNLVRPLSASILALLAAGALAAASPADPAPVVSTASGSVRGEALTGGGAVFKGIPFAAPPVGPLRWSPPAPAASWNGVRDATAFSHACLQPDQMWNHAPATNGSEDCLYLNVWTPKLSASAHLPVMVWIHGGGFVGGAGTESIFSGENFAARGVILVTLNYRLGVFGFLAHPELSASAADKSSGNYGLRDQVAALKWVRANIARFGGDPKNITIFGQSAGGGSVIDLLASPMAAGIPRQAIVESGAALRMIQTPALADAEAKGSRFAGGATIAQLRAMPAAEIMQRFGAFAQQGMQNQLGPIVDGRVLTDDAQAIFARGGQQKVPLIIGNNAREGFGRMPDAALPDLLAKTYGADAAAAMGEYAPGADAALGSPGAMWLTDSSFRCGAVITAQRHSATGAPVYEYQFEQSLPGRDADGAAHSYELPFVFGNLLPDGVLGGAYTPADRALSDAMIGYWTNFAKTGNPNGNGAPAWRRFDAHGRAYLRFSTRFAGGVKADTGLRKNACALYERSLVAR